MEYPRALLDHYRRPRHRVRLAEPSGSAHVVNPLCGDEVTMDVVLDGGRVASVGFEAVGCAICIGAADMAADGATGAATGEVLAWEPSDAEARIGMALPPGRRRCGMLGTEALQAAVRRAAERVGDGV